MGGGVLKDFDTPPNLKIPNPPILSGAKITPINTGIYIFA